MSEEKHGTRERDGSPAAVTLSAAKFGVPASGAGHEEAHIAVSACPPSRMGCAGPAGPSSSPRPVLAPHAHAPPTAQAPTIAQERTLARRQFIVALARGPYHGEPVSAAALRCAKTTQNEDLPSFALN